MSMRIVGQHPITETILGIAVAMLTVISIGVGLLAGFGDLPRYLRLKRM